MRPAWLPLLAVATAFGVAEAAVVVELRRWLDPSGARFPAIEFPAELVRIEQLRELATLFLLAAASALAVPGASARCGAFLFLFGAWDLAYYLALRLLLDWPRSLADWDLLFLVPVPWFGPVWAPVLVATVMLVCGAAALDLAVRRGRFVVHPVHVGAALVGAGLLLASFLRWDGILAPPANFAVERFAIGLAIGACAFADAWRRNARDRH